MQRKVIALYSLDWERQAQRNGNLGNILNAYLGNPLEWRCEMSPIFIMGPTRDTRNRFVRLLCGEFSRLHPTLKVESLSGKGFSAAYRKAAKATQLAEWQEGLQRVTLLIVREVQTLTEDVDPHWALHYVIDRRREATGLLTLITGSGEAGEEQHILYNLRTRFSWGLGRFSVM